MATTGLVNNLLNQMPGTGTFILLFVLFGIGPLLAVVTTSYLKISVVVMLVRNAVGVQDVPPSLAINGLALILSMYIMAPIGWTMVQNLNQPGVNLQKLTKPATQKAITNSIDPLRSFLARNTHKRYKDFFVSSAKKTWADEIDFKVAPDDMIVLIPAFTVNQLASAFETAFLIFLPFVAIDLIVANILMALGMIMLSPLTVSLPFKLLLFVAVNGWTLLLQGLIMSYH